MVHAAISNILHREIKRLHTRVEKMEERIVSIEESQHGGMVKVHTRVEKLEMDSEDLHAALRRCLDEKNSPTPNMSMSTPGNRSELELNADEVPTAEEEKLKGLGRESQNMPGLVEALERTCGQVEAVEKRVVWLWNHHRSLQQDLDWLRSEYTRHNKDLKELQLLVKSPQGSIETSQERWSQINPQEQPMSRLQEGYESSSRTASGLTVPGGISRFENFQQMGLSNPNVEASDKDRLEGQGPSTLPAKFSQTFPFDLDFRTNFTAAAENISPERKTNMDIDSHEEDQLQAIPSSARTDVKDAASFHQFESYEFNLLHTEQVFPAGNLGDEYSLKEELKLERPGGLSAVRQLHLKPQHEAAEGRMDELIMKGDAASDIVGGSITNSPNMPSATDSENVSTSCVQEENAAKTNKVLEAYGIDLLVEY